MCNENKKILIYDIATNSGRRMQIKKLLEEILVLKSKITEVLPNKEPKVFEKYRLELQTLENAMTVIRLIQADDRLKQNIWKILFGIIGGIVGFFMKGLIL
ncbi:MAG: hypothetical protein N3F66_12505 [Spirochaetes bacterium]|nr:hypothetical protein [Spirochaetota bacterium]